MAIVKRGDVYHVAVMYRDELNVKRYKWKKVGPSIREAEKVERQLRTDLERKTLKASKRIKLSNFFDDWLKDIVRPTRAPSTYENYSYAVKYIKESLGNIYVDDLLPVQIYKFINKMKKLVSPTTVHNHFCVLKIALNSAIRDYKLITANPCDLVETPAKNKPKNNAYTAAQTMTILDIMQKTIIYIPVLLYALCGLRRGESAALQWPNVYIDKKQADILHSLDRLDREYAMKLKDEKEPKYIPIWQSIKKSSAKTVLALGPVKTDESEQSIALPDFVIKELKTLQLEQKWDKQLLGEAYKDLGFVCCWPDGTPFDPDFIYHKFQDVLKEYNKTAEEKLPIYRIHDLRHTHGTILLEKNVDVKIVSRALRHSRASFTRDLYQHVLDDMLPESANIMDEVFNKEKSNEKNNGLDNGLDKAN